MLIIDKVAWIEIQNQTILSTRSKGKNVFYIPGGKREFGENDTATLIREIKEELSVELQANSLKYLGTFESQADGQSLGIMVRMTCYYGKFIGELKPAAEIEELAWLRYEDKYKSSEVDKMIFDWLKSNHQL